ncbi:MAG: hypothetical protein RMI56_00635 [Sulfolobales archaeon]|nr:hypothetical protein [Sulfolobales archaeon]MDW8082286.1 hypothetical protein [Sulfolobales archaeon]
MFKLVYGNGSRFRSIFLGLARPLSSIPIRVTPSGLEFRALTSDNNMMVEATFPSNVFESIEAASDTTLALSRDGFLRSVKRAGKRDTITIQYEKASRYLRLLLTNVKTGVEREFSIEISEAITELIEPIQVELPVRFQISLEDFKKLIRDVIIVGDEVELTYRDNSIEVSSTSEGRSYKTSLALDRPLYLLESREDEVSSKYYVDYLKTVVSTLSITELIDVEFGSSLPLKIYASLEDGTKITTWIAPRV